MKKKAFNQTDAAFDFKQAQHVHPQEYCKIRDQVSICTDSINRWLSRNPKNNQIIENALTAIMRNLFCQDAFNAYSLPFQLSIYSENLPSSIQSEPFHPPCQFAQDVLTCHHLLLKQLMSQEHIPLVRLHAKEAPAYPKYDQWLVSAANKISLEEADQLYLDFCNSTFNVEENPEEARQKLQSIIDASEKNLRQEQFINAYFAETCPICYELLRLKRVN